MIIDESLAQAARDYYREHALATSICLDEMYGVNLSPEDCLALVDEVMKRTLHSESARRLGGIIQQ